MSRHEIVQKYPLTHEDMDLEYALGYFIKASSHLGIQEAHWQHLIKEMLVSLENISLDAADYAFANPNYKKSGFIQLGKWELAKGKMNRPIRQEEKEALMGGDRLEDIEVTEREAVGYMILAARKLGFLDDQIMALEAEFTYLLRTMQPEEAYAVYLDFVDE